MAHIGAKVEHVLTGQTGEVIQYKRGMYLIQFGPVSVHSYGMYHETEIMWADGNAPTATLNIREITSQNAG